ncbi:hypothetical protein Tco_1108336 [Tanacetum coccineum]
MSLMVHKHMVPRAVLMKTGLKTVNNARPVNTVRSVNTVRPFSTARSFNTVRPSYTAHPKSTVHCARPRTHFQNQAQSTVQRPFCKRTALTKRSNNQMLYCGQIVNTGSKMFNTVRQRDLMHCKKGIKSKDNRNWNQGSSSKAVKIEDASEKAMCAIDGAGFD